MNPERFPPDWHDLEDQLARRACPEPAPNLRGRVLSAMTNARALPVSTLPAGRWRLVWRAAAAAVIVLNLAMSAANGIRFQRLTALAANPPDSARRAVWPTDADGYDANDLLQTLTAIAAAQLAPIADIGPLGRNVFNVKEKHAWALP